MRAKIPKPGDYRLAWIGRYPIIMVRAPTRKCGCFRTVAAIAQTPSAKSSAVTLTSSVCDYHGWSYNNTGELATVTYADGYDSSFHKEDFGLVPVPRMATYRGFIFGSVSPTGTSLEEHIGKATEQIDLFVDLSPEREIDARAGVHKYNYHGNWKLQI
jgi:benzoate/toluate 1,2-dioxygenase alpha subunit